MTVVLGRAYCGMCDSEDSKVLIIRNGNIYSKCQRCGFVEWEWQKGDSFDYLKYLAERYDVPLEELLKAIEEG